MPTDDEKDELDDGSAGGAVKWSADNVVKPASAAPGAPVSWENLFGGPQPAASHSPGPPQPASPSSADSQPDMLFARGPGGQSAPKAEPSNNPFTTFDISSLPTGAPGAPPAPAQPTGTGTGAGFNAVPAGGQGLNPGRQTSTGTGFKAVLGDGQGLSPRQPTGTGAGFNAVPAGGQVLNPGQPTGTGAGFNAVPAGGQVLNPGQPTGTGAGFNAVPGGQPPQPQTGGGMGSGQNPVPPTPPTPPPAPPRPPAPPPAPPRPPAPAQTTSSTGHNPAPGNPEPSGEPPAPKVYFTADDIEEEIAKELGLPSQTQGGGGMPAAKAPPPGPAPYGVQAQPQAQSYGTGTPPFPGAKPAYGQAPGAPSSPSASSPYGQAVSPAAKPAAPKPPGEEGEDGPDLSQVPELETARIWEQRTAREILHGIVKNKKSDYAVALFASTDNKVQGEMLVVKSTVIHGAKLVEPDVSGYDALKIMLTIPHGSYTLLDVTNYVESAQNLEQGLNIRLTPLANALPHLPDTEEELAGASQISRIRSKGPADLDANEPAPKPPKRQMSLRERLPSTKMMVLIAFTVLALIMMVVVLYTTR